VIASSNRLPQTSVINGLRLGQPDRFGNRRKPIEWSPHKAPARSYKIIVYFCRPMLSNGKAMDAGAAPRRENEPHAQKGANPRGFRDRGVHEPWIVIV